MRRNNETRMCCERDNDLSHRIACYGHSIDQCVKQMMCNSKKKDSYENEIQDKGFYTRIKASKDFSNPEDTSVTVESWSRLICSLTLHKAEEEEEQQIKQEKEDEEDNQWETVQPWAHSPILSKSRDVMTYTPVKVKTLRWETFLRDINQGRGQTYVKTSETKQTHLNRGESSAGGKSILKFVSENGHIPGGRTERTIPEEPEDVSRAKMRCTAAFETILVKGEPVDESEATIQLDSHPGDLKQKEKVSQNKGERTRDKNNIILLDDEIKQENIETDIKIKKEIKDNKLEDTSISELWYTAKTHLESRISSSNVKNEYDKSDKSSEISGN